LVKAALHPLDRAKLRRLAEALCDISAGRLATRDPLLPLVERLMVCLRDDCSADGAERLADRLLSVAEHRLGADARSDIAAVKRGDDERMFFSWYGGDFTTDPALANAEPERRANSFDGVLGWPRLSRAAAQAPADPQIPTPTPKPVCKWTAVAGSSHRRHV
jgi:hypothetical protein